jgi:hypothetical protein
MAAIVVSSWAAESFMQISTSPTVAVQVPSIGVVVSQVAVSCWGGASTQAS